jgi:hypothetical protein
MPKPEYWPSNIPWSESYVIVGELESYPPVYILNTGTKIRGELQLSDYVRATYVPPCDRKKKIKRKKSRKSRRKSRKLRKKSRKSKKKY